MKYLITSLFFLSLFYSCNNDKNSEKTLENNSFWVGELIIDGSNSVRFNFSINNLSKDSSFVTIFNGDEELKQKLTLKNDSLFFAFPVFDTWFNVELKNDSLMSGKLEIPSKKRSMDFVA